MDLDGAAHSGRRIVAVVARFHQHKAAVELSEINHHWPGFI